MAAKPLRAGRFFASLFSAMLLYLVLSPCVYASASVAAHASMPCPSPGCAGTDDPVSLLTLGTNVRHRMRLDEPGKPVCEGLGPLRGLLGVWKGVGGVSVAFAPSGGTGHSAQEPVTMYHEYQDTMTFEPLTDTVFNRGRWGAGQQILTAVTFKQTLQAAGGNETKPHDADHFETGQWLYNQQPGAASWTIGRTVAIPHGVGLTATGSHSKQDLSDVLLEQQQLNNWTNLNFHDKIDKITNSLNASINDKIDTSLPGELRPELYEPLRQWRFGDVLRQSLQTSLAMGEVSSRSPQAWRLQMGTKTIHVDSSLLPDARLGEVMLDDFQSTFWLFENTTTQVLQYFQNVNFLFGPKSGHGEPCFADQPASECLMAWPHVQMGTLVKIRNSICDDP